MQNSSLDELIRNEISNPRTKNEFYTIWIGNPKSFKYNALILEKDKIINLSVNVQRFYCMKQDNGKVSGRIRLCFQGEDIDWNGDYHKVVSMVEDYRKSNTVILGFGPGKTDEKAKKISSGISNALKTYVPVE